jgi:thioredoxin-related protein
MRHLYKSFILLTTLFLVACGSSNDEHLDLNEETKSESNSHQEYAKKVFNSIPDPLVLTQIINDEI